MNWKNFLVPPVAIYAVIFLFISALIGAKIDQTATWVWVVSLVIDIIGLYIASKYVAAKDTKEGLTYGLAWVLIFVILDFVLTVPFTGTGFFADWHSYIPYALALLMPTIFRK